MSNKMKSQEKANRITEIDDHIRRNFEIIKVNTKKTWVHIQGLLSWFKVSKRLSQFYEKLFESEVFFFAWHWLQMSVASHSVLFSFFFQFSGKYFIRNHDKLTQAKPSQAEPNQAMLSYAVYPEWILITWKISI